MICCFVKFNVLSLYFVVVIIHLYAISYINQINDVIMQNIKILLIENYVDLVGHFVYCTPGLKSNP